MTPARWHGVVLAGSVLLGLVVGGWAAVAQERSITITGQVTNATLGGAAPADLPITLHVFSQDGEATVYTTTTTFDGGFRLDGVTVERAESAFARTVYRGVTYTSELATLEPGRATLALALTVYEPTKQRPDVRITRLRIVLERVADQLWVGEHYLIGNDARQTWIGSPADVGERRITLAFSLPDDAQALWFDGPGLGERFVAWDGGFADTQPVVPGDESAEVLFGYRLPYRDGMDVTRAFDASVDSILLLSPQAGGLSVAGETITPVGGRGTTMGAAESYVAAPLAEHQRLTFSVDAGSPAAPTGVAWYEIGIGLFALIAAFGAAYWLWRPPGLPAEAAPLVEAIAALDADFEDGRLTERVYRQERTALKAQIRRLLRERPEEGR